MNRRLMIAALMAWPFAGCGGPTAQGPKPGAPPLEFRTVKPQNADEGLVVGIRNTSDVTMDAVVVSIESPTVKGRRSYRHDKPLSPEDTIAVGAKELDGWKLKASDKLKVKCRQYSGEAEYTVPAE